MNSLKRFWRMILLLLLLTLACRLPGRGGGGAEPAGENSPANESVADAPAVTDDLPTPFMDRFSIVQSDHPNAVCNDGTTPVFYFRRGVGDGADKWVIWFKGGGTGWSAETFRNRGPTITSNTPWLTDEFAQLASGGNAGSPDGEAAGILSSVPEENPDFYNWNHAYLVYCSSDGWTGTRPAGPETGDLHFAGHYIVDAMIAALQDPDVIGTPTLADATQILLTGSSAGALGLRSNVDRLADMLSFADVRAISDAGVFHWGNPAFQPEFEATAREQYEMWQPILDADCEAAYPGEPWLCLSGGLLVESGFIQTPMFIHQDQSDIKLQEAFEARGFDVAEGVRLVGAATRPLLAIQNGVYSPNAGRHIIINNSRFNAFRLNGLTFATVFGNWYFDREGPTVVIEYP